MEDYEIENTHHCIHVCIDIRDIGMYRNILTYCYMVGTIHNMNQPIKINFEWLHKTSTVLLVQYNIWIAIPVRDTLYSLGRNCLCLDLVLFSTFMKRPMFMLLTMLILNDNVEVILEHTYFVE